MTYYIDPITHSIVFLDQKIQEDLEAQRKQDEKALLLYGEKQELLAKYDQ